MYENLIILYIFQISALKYTFSGILNNKIGANYFQK